MTQNANPGGEITALSLSQVDRHASSYIDPNGFVFRREGEFLRAIHRDVEDFYRGLLEDGTLERLTRDHGLVATEVAPYSVPEASADLVLRHEAVAPMSYCVEWCPSMLRDAALTTLDIALAVHERGCLLQDAYPWNVVFKSAKPVLVDLTSIVPAAGGLAWPAYGQFQAFFLHPLLLAAQGKGDVARSMLFNNIQGVTLEDFSRHVGAGYKLRHPGIILASLANRLIQRNTGLKKKLKRAIDTGNKTVDPNVRARFLRNLRARTEALSFASQSDIWDAYYAEIGADVDRRAKVDIVGKLLDQTAPETVLDLGCNTGVFSLLAAERGARVVAVDSSEMCVERLYALAKADGLAITPLVSDVLCPTPAFGFLGREFPALYERAASDLVMCLGLMHHLHISGRQPFGRIAELLAAASKRHLIFEFVGQDDDNNILLGAGRPIAYDLDEVKAALSEHFQIVADHASDRPTRRMLLCEKKT